MHKIVLIEDNLEMRENIEEMLELADYQVLSAKNGKEGVELVKRELPDIIVCDIMMPELDGYGVLYYLSKIPDTRAIPFIFLSAKSERQDFRKGMNLGADDYITKPFEEMELLEAIESRLKKRERFQAVNETDDKWKGFQDVVCDLTGLDDLRDAAQIKSFGKREGIYFAGDTPKWLYYVKEGHVRNYKVTKDDKELVTGLYGEGEFFGYIDLLSQGAYKEYAVAIEGAKLALIAKSDFEQLMLSNKDVSINFIKLLAGDIVEKENELVSLAYNTVRKRVANALSKLYVKYKEGLAERVEVTVTRDELASMVGTATESVIRILSEFKKDGYIKTKGSLITILDYPALKDYRF
ncbi:transcriptional regulator [Brumimicrobium salinarum]|uniref:Transcriptional regulator n=1 Tax=Brumimicrobium salinarum TaxID=2058658 RepID=A0A2I0QYV1_9FLAO|nr:response regulator [Brumimicrobium salinarum]PKR79523.1 transcriptional regulator [Brumimicrobium salinarum]